MVLVGQGMEPEEAFTKVQVVYYLSRGGQLQQPHLIDVPVSTHSNGLYLRGQTQNSSSCECCHLGLEIMSEQTRLSIIFLVPSFCCLHRRSALEVAARLAVLRVNMQNCGL